MQCMPATHKLRWWIAGGVVLLLLGFVVARPGAVPFIAPLETPAATIPPALIASPSADTALVSPQPTATQLVVYVCGAVRRPGVYRFAPGSRVNDAIERAGGAVADADLEQLNLAQTLLDAMKVNVPKKGQILAAALAEDGSSSQPESVASHRSRHRSGRSSHKLQPGQSLDINTATESELTQLPGVGPGLARRIVEYRTSNGPFQTVDDLQNVSGIGPSKFDRMAPYIHL